MNRHVVVRQIDRAAADVIDRLGAAGTATVHEAIGRVGFVGPHLRPIQQGAKIAGSAVTRTPSICSPPPSKSSALSGPRIRESPAARPVMATVK